MSYVKITLQSAVEKSYASREDLPWRHHTNVCGKDAQKETHFTLEMKPANKSPKTVANSMTTEKVYLVCQGPRSRSMGLVFMYLSKAYYSRQKTEATSVLTI
jgi:hypothetical protein